MAISWPELGQFADRAGNSMIRDLRLRTADDLDARADLIDQRKTAPIADCGTADLDQGLGDRGASNTLAFAE